MTHGNSRQSFPLFIVEPLRDGLGNPLVDFPGEMRGPAAKLVNLTHLTAIPATPDGESCALDVYVVHV